MKKFLLIILLLLPSMARADSASGYCGTATSVGNKWVNASNAEGSGDNSCTSYNGTKQDELDLSNFGITLAGSGNTIDSINLYIDGFADQNGDKTIEISLCKVAGTPLTSWYTHDLYYIISGDCSYSQVTNEEGNGLWGETWSESDFEGSTGAGCIIRDANGTANLLLIDAVQMVVWYTTPSGAIMSASGIATGIGKGVHK